MAESNFVDYVKIYCRSGKVISFYMIGLLMTKSCRF